MTTRDDRAGKVLVVDDTPHNVKLLADLLARQGLRGRRPRRTARRRWRKLAADDARPRAARRDDAGHVRLRRLPAHPRRPRDGAAAGRAGHLARPAGGARQGHRGRRRRFPVASRSTRRSCSRACARCCASSRCRTRCRRQADALAGLERASSRSASPSRSRELERLGQLKRFFSPRGRRGDRRRRRDSRSSRRIAARSATCSSTCAASPRSPTRAEPEEVRGGAARVPRGDGRARSPSTRARSIASPATAS